MTTGSKARTEIRELIGELVDRWAPTMASRTWPERLALLAEIHEQLLEDLGNFDVFAEVSPAFIAGLVERLGDGPPVCEEQAHIYANSGDQRHRQMAGQWFEKRLGNDTGNGTGDSAAASPSDRRTRPRRVVNLPASLEADGRRVDCRLIDISDAGALVEAPALKPPVGKELDLDIPNYGSATGAVVRLAPPHFALAFRQPVDAATVH